MTDFLSLTHWVHVYSLCDATPTFRTVVNSYMTDYTPYFHSFGLTSKYAVLPHNLFTVDFNAVVFNGGFLSKSFKNVSRTQQEVYVVPLNGDSPIQFLLPTGVNFYYLHHINTYESADGNDIIFDMAAYNENPMLGGLISIAEQTNKASRDAIQNRAFLARLTLTVNGPNKGQTDYKSFGTPDEYKFTDFCRSNPLYNGVAYCFVYCNQWFHDGKALGSMAVTKFNLCLPPGSNNQVASWYIPSTYPSEPTFIPSDHPDAAEDDGLLMFTSTDGILNQSKVEFVNAATMQSVWSVPLPQRVTFTTHGEFYQNYAAITNNARKHPQAKSAF
jgi:carotenoid cleavage dioxygenase-like enzyme